MILTQVQNTIANKGLIKKGDRVLVCVSGGPDSIALLHLMVDLRKHYDIELAVAHLDHMLRGRQSAADANFVKRITAKLGIPFVIEKKNVKKIANSPKMSIEERAREARYNFYQRAAKKTGANKIATGHNMDDQAETILMRFVKGSGSRGLSGIPYKRQLGHTQVIRPLLDVKRADIEEYLKKHRLPSRVDASNFKTFYLRNKIRHILMPFLEKEFNPKIKENLKSIAKNLSNESDYLGTVARRLYKHLTSGTKARIEISLRDLLRQHIALQPLIVREIICSLKGDLKRITYRHWQEIESILTYKDKWSIDLPGKIKVNKKGGRLIFMTKDITQKHLPRFKKSAKLNIPGKTVIPELGINLSSEIVTSIPRFKKGRKGGRIEYVNGDLLKPPLKIRTRHKGDRMRPLGMEFSKKLHDIFVDEKVPQEIRDRIPLIISGNKILWVVGLKLAGDSEVNRTTAKLVKLPATPFITK